MRKTNGLEALEAVRGGVAGAMERMLQRGKAVRGMGDPWSCDGMFDRRLLGAKSRGRRSCESCWTQRAERGRRTEAMERKTETAETEQRLMDTDH
jgi:hypothetical protein